jgi:hypothetical protein
LDLAPFSRAILAFSSGVIMVPFPFGWCQCKQPSLARGLFVAEVFLTRLQASMAGQGS